MKKTFIILAVTFVMALTLTACGGNTGKGEADDIIDTQAENPADVSAENIEGIQAENQADTQPENQMAVKEENEAELKQADESAVNDDESENEEETGGRTEMKMNVQIGDYNFTATLESNTAVEELVEMMKEGPVTIEMDDYSGFEKVGPLGKSLTTSNSQTTTHAGDIVLYSGNNIVMFYGSNSWSYTRIGKIDDLTDWEKALGSGSITAVFTVAE